MRTPASLISGGFDNPTVGNCGTGPSTGEQEAANTNSSTYQGTYSIY